MSATRGPASFWTLALWLARIVLAFLCVFWVSFIGLLSWSYYQEGFTAVHQRIAHLEDLSHVNEPLRGGDEAILRLHHAYENIIALILLTWLLSWTAGVFKKKRNRYL